MTTKRMTIDIYEVSDFASQLYRKFVKGNINLSNEEVAKRLTRNVILGYPIIVNDNHIWYCYGRLRILVKNKTRITCIVNNQQHIKGWKLNKSLKKLIDRELEIA